MIFGRQQPQQQVLPFPKQVFISVTRAARLLECSKDTVYRLIQEGKLRAYRLRTLGWWRVEYDSVVEFHQTVRNSAL